MALTLPPKPLPTTTKSNSSSDSDRGDGDADTTDTLRPHRVPCNSTAERRPAHFHSLVVVVRFVVVGIARAFGSHIPGRDQPVFLGLLVGGARGLRQLLDAQLRHAATRELAAQVPLHPRARFRQCARPAADDQTPIGLHALAPALG